MRNWQFSLFLATGAVNTCIGYALIFLLQLFLKNPFSANAIGFALASIFSYLSHSRFTFKKRISWQRAFLYLVITLFCFLVNLLVLKIAIGMMPIWPAQFLAITVYVILSYIGLSRYGFSDRFYTEAREDIHSDIRRS